MNTLRPFTPSIPPAHVALHAGTLNRRGRTEATIHSPLPSETYHDTLRTSSLPTKNPRLRAYFQQASAKLDIPPHWSTIPYGSAPLNSPSLETKGMTQEQIAAKILLTPQDSTTASHLSRAGLAHFKNPDWLRLVESAATTNGGLGSSEHGFLAWSKEGFIRLRNLNLSPEQNRRVAEVSLTLGVPVEDLAATQHKSPSFTTREVSASVENFLSKFERELTSFVQNPADGIAFREGRHHYELAYTKDSPLPVSHYYKKARGLKRYAQKLLPYVQPALQAAGLFFAPATGGVSLTLATAGQMATRAAAYGKQTLTQWKELAYSAASQFSGGTSSLARAIMEKGTHWKDVARSVLDYLGERYHSKQFPLLQEGIRLGKDYLDDGKISGSTLSRAVAGVFGSLIDRAKDSWTFSGSRASK